MNDKILWTNLTCLQISSYFKKFNINVGVYVVKQLLKKFGFVKRKLYKNRTLKVVENRNTQFEHIKVLRENFAKENLPILSIDTKKKEMLGNFYRKGETYSIEKKIVDDHDFDAEGVIIPQGLYDTQKNTCYLTIGKSKDTAEFVCDNIEYHWYKSLKNIYPDAKRMLMLCDGGGSNSCLHYIVKEEFQKLANRLQIEIVMAHYPAYSSKWNPIEHKVFCHLTRTWQGVVFDNYDIVKELAEQTVTKTGLSVIATINDKNYVTGRKASDEFKENMPVVFDRILPKWNYTFKPKLL